MKKGIHIAILTICALLFCGFSYMQNNKANTFNINDLYNYQKKYKTEELELCANSQAKTYMDYRMITAVSSRQYQYIYNYLSVDHNTGFLYDQDGFIAVALGSYFGEIGERFYFTLESGIVLPLVKAEEKADVDTDARGCYHLIDTSVIEFVIDEDYAANYFWSNRNGYVLNGNYNNFDLFSGEITKIEKALDEENEKYVTYEVNVKLPKRKNIFYYASGY